MKNPICYIDRDGVINRHYPYVGKRSLFVIDLYILNLIEFLDAKGYTFVIATNQSGIARGYYSLSDFIDLSSLLLELLPLHVNIEIRCCPHLPSSNCRSRKPMNGMVNSTVTSDDIFIGDADTDMECAALSHIPHRWQISSCPSMHSTNCFSSLKELVAWLVDSYSNY